MSSEAKQRFGQVLAARRRGEPSTANALTSFEDAKFDFYADGKILSGAILHTFNAYRDQYPPYGLIDMTNQPATDFSGTYAWSKLERAFTSTMRLVFAETEAPIDSCPYHEVLAQRLGRLAQFDLGAQDHNERGIDTLREVSFPGAHFAPATIISLLRRIPAMKAVHGGETSLEELARNSKFTLLGEPLAHPQQHAKAFIYTLAEAYGGTDEIMDRGTFLPEELIASNMRLGLNPQGREAFTWAMPTEDFTLRSDVRVASRTMGYERGPGDHQILYPAGTRLGDIAISEPTIGCPGSQVAYAMWDRGIDVISGENLWAA